MSYQIFVVTRIEELIEQARKLARARTGAPPEVRQAYAVPEIVTLAVTALAFVVTLFL